MRNYASPRGDTAAADVAVVGAGVAGLAVAREAARRGLSVTLIEAGGANEAGASRAAAGMLAPQAEAERADDFFRFQQSARDFYPAFAAALYEESGRDVELDRTGTLYLALDDEDEAELRARHEWQTRAALPVERLTTAEARELEPLVSERVRMALRFPRDWQVENRKLVEALGLSVEQAYAGRVRWMRETTVTSLRTGPGGRVEGLETSRGFVAAGAVVVAAGARSSLITVVANDDARANAGGAARVEADAPRIEPVRGQMLCFAQTSLHAPLRHVVYTPRGYVVPRRDGRLLAGSTTERAGFSASVTPEGVRAIRARAVEIAPAIEGLPLTDSWAGLRPCAEDELPVVGESASVAGLFYATGHYRNGILLAPLTGEIVAALVAGEREYLSGLPFDLRAFSPARVAPALAASQVE
ncbi:MAG TPA: glycine oxidase ThiO [Pyrinomonadaceae bacterium]|nr:glycine oxidase ThiO [Pyrinomonadaceae bacterium]